MNNRSIDLKTIRFACESRADFLLIEMHPGKVRAILQVVIIFLRQAGFLLKGNQPVSCFLSVLRTSEEPHESTYKIFEDIPDIERESR